MRAVVCLSALGSGCDGGGANDKAPVAVGSKPPVREPVAPEAASSTVPLRIVLIADLEGVLEPCGCTSRPLGGVDRLAAAVAALRHDARALLVVAAGDVFATGNDEAVGRVAAPQARMQDAWKADALAAALGRTRIDVLVPSDGAVARNAKRVAMLASEARARLVGAGPHTSALDAMAATARLRAGDTEVGLIALGQNDDVAASTRVAALRNGGAEVVVAYFHGAIEGARAVAAGAGADFVVHTGDGDRPAGATAMPNGTLLLHGGRNGERVLSLDVWPGQPSHAVVAKVHDLDRSVAADPALRELLDQLFARVNAHNEKAYRALAPHVPAKGQSSFVGSRTCAACHTQAYVWWQQTPHARAFETLLGRHRQLDLDCIGCHVTGYQRPGGSTVGHLDELKGVGCESCHGAGSAHVDNPQRRVRTIVRAVPERTCVACHDAEHSDVFRYAQAREQLLAPGHAQQSRP